jgi:chromate transporter
VRDISAREALAFWFKLGFISFGGPAGQIALMHRELVERRRWISEGRFLHALHYCMLLPGPEAQQLATYLGWLMHRTAGGIAAGVLFVLPSLFILIGLAWAYMALGDQPAVAGFFAGVRPAVAAIVLQAVWRLGGRTLAAPAERPLLWAIALSAFLAIAWLELPFPAVVGAAALAGWCGAYWAPTQFQAGGGGGHGPVGAGSAAVEGAGHARAAAVIDDHSLPPAHARFSRRGLIGVLFVGALLWLLPMGVLVALGGADGVLATMGRFFTQAALVTFGGAYAVLPYVHQGAVEQQQWLTAAQMIDGMALGESTPGPLIMVVAFVGFVGGWTREVLDPGWPALGGALGAAVATWFTFLPSFVFILAGGPWVESSRGRPTWTAPLVAISAAVVGVIASLGLFFVALVARGNALSGGGPLGLDLPALALMVLALAVLLRGRVGVVPVILGCGVVGLIWRLAAP